MFHRKKLQILPTAPVNQFFCNIFATFSPALSHFFVDAKHICHMFPTKDPPCLEIPKLQGGIISPAQCQFPIPRDLQASPKRLKFSPKQNPEPTAFWSSMRQHHPASKHIPDPQRLSFANQIRVSIEYGRPRCGTGVPKLQRTFAIAEASESRLPGAHSTCHLTHT